MKFVYKVVDGVDSFLLRSGLMCVFRHMWRVSRTEVRVVERKGKRLRVTVSHEVCMRCLRRKEVVR